MNTSTVENIATLASTVAAEHAASVEAHAAVTEAEAVLLERVVEAARPALRAISTRLRTSERVWWPTSVETATECANGPIALRVVGNGAGYDHPRANAGKYEGTDLLLLPDGSWVERTYSGSWSRWQGSSSAWESEDTLLAVAEVARDYDAYAVIAAIGEALTKAKGTREKPSARALERAAKVRAVAELVR
jgi:hypothetical protein